MVQHLPAGLRVDMHTAKHVLIPGGCLSSLFVQVVAGIRCISIECIKLRSCRCKPAAYGADRHAKDCGYLVIAVIIAEIAQQHARPQFI